MRKHPRHFPLMLAVLLASGCSAPLDIIDNRFGRAPQISTAPIAEMYTLMDSNANRRIEATTFNFADDIGFVRDNGRLEAVAADDRIPLANGNYSWVIERPRFRFPSRGPSHASQRNSNFRSARGAIRYLAAAVVAATVVGAVNAAP